MTSLPAIVVHPEHLPCIIEGATHAANLGRLGLECEECKGTGCEVGFEASWFGSHSCKQCRGFGRVALPGEPTDLVLVADGKAWGTLFGVQFLSVVVPNDRPLTDLGESIILTSTGRLFLHRWSELFSMWQSTEIAEALPCGPWESGDTAIVWSGFKPTITCLLCGGRGRVPVPDIEFSLTCQQCDGERQSLCPISIKNVPDIPGPTTINWIINDAH